MSTARRILTGADVLPPMESEPSPAKKPPKRKPKSASGRFGMLNRFVDESMRTLDGTAACVWFVLYRDTKRDGTTRTGQTDIARRVGCSVRSVRRAIRRLQDRDLLIVVRTGRLNVGPTIYRVRAGPNSGAQ